jgi:hypothetical protein
VATGKAGRGQEIPWTSGPGAWKKGGSLPPVRPTYAHTEYQKMPAQKGNRSKKKLSNRASNKKSALKRRRDRARRK